MYKILQSRGTAHRLSKELVSLQIYIYTVWITLGIYIRDCKCYLALFGMASTRYHVHVGQCCSRQLDLQVRHSTCALTNGAVIRPARWTIYGALYTLVPLICVSLYFCFTHTYTTHTHTHTYHTHTYHTHAHHTHAHHTHTHTHTYHTHTHHTHTHTHTHTYTHTHTHTNRCSLSRMKEYKSCNSRQMKQSTSWP